MSGEESKSSGEIGEKLASALLKKIGWKNVIDNFSIDCHDKTHLNNKNKQKSTHGEDHVFIYHNPFHDNRIDIVHISDKNTINKYPSESKLKTNFKDHIKSLSETISCAKNSPKLHEISSGFKDRKQQYHSGLLIWLQNDLDGIEQDIKPTLSNSSRLDMACEAPIYIIDNARASFLVKIVDNLESRSNGKYQFFYPRIGTGLTEETMRTGNIIPLELIASDIIPAVIETERGRELIIYADESFDKENYKTLIDYALKFNSSLLKTIHIGMNDYNPATHGHDTDTVRSGFSERTEKIIPFSFKSTILDLLESE
jgi:hypothetical protein